MHACSTTREREGDKRERRRERETSSSLLSSSSCPRIPQRKFRSTPAMTSKGCLGCLLDHMHSGNHSRPSSLSLSLCACVFSLSLSPLSVFFSLSLSLSQPPLTSCLLLQQYFGRIDAEHIAEEGSAVLIHRGLTPASGMVSVLAALQEREREIDR